LRILSGWLADTSAVQSSGGCLTIPLPDRSAQRLLRRPGSGLLHQSPTIAVAVACRRQCDQARTMQTQQPHPATHQLRAAQGVMPPQRIAHPPRHLGAQRRVGFQDRPPDRLQVRRTQRSPAQLANTCLAHLPLPHRW